MSARPSTNLAAVTLGPARTIKDGPFCWQSKDILRVIHDAFSESGNLPSACSVYLSLTILASDEQSDTFTARKALIAFKAGVSIRTAGDVLNRLEGLRVVGIARQSSTNGHPDGPSTYTLFRVSNGCTGVSNGCTPVGNEPQQSFVADKVEESEKNLPLRKGKEKPSPAKGLARASLEECKSFAIELGLPETDGEAFFYAKEGNGWKNGKNPVLDWRATFRSWKANDWHPSQKSVPSKQGQRKEPRRDALGRPLPHIVL